MTDQELYAKVLSMAQVRHGLHDLTQKEVTKILTSLSEVFTAELLAGNSISLPGICEMEIHLIPERVKTDAKTGKERTMEAHRAVRVIRTAKGLRKSLAEAGESA